MAEQEDQTVDQPENETEQEDFSPVGSLALTMIYIIIFAVAWALVYFNDLLARR